VPGNPSDIPRDAFDLLLLERLPGVGLATVQRLVQRFGTPDRALAASNRDFAAVASGAAARARTSRELRGQVETALEVAQRECMTVLTWSCPAYPGSLRHLADPPPVLFLKGRTELLDRRAVTVVGARRSTARSKDFAHRLGAALARAGCTVVSGLALGIDRAAHEGALRVGGDTVAVLGTGVDVAYPRSHAPLFRRIGERGLLVSEFLPATRAAPHHFPRRNRILAALSVATVVVEAGRKSGALITVDHALDIGREVWIVPGPIESVACEGSNRLLAEGARPVLSIPDLVRCVGGDADRAPARGTSDGGRPRNAEPPGAAPGAKRDRGPDVTSHVLAALADGPLTVDELASRLGLAPSEALALLTGLELHGDVERLAGMRFRWAA